MKIRCLKVLRRVLRYLLSLVNLVNFTKEINILSCEGMFYACFLFHQLEAGRVTEEDNIGTKLLLIIAIIVLKLYSKAFHIKDQHTSTLLYHCTASMSEIAIHFDFHYTSCNTLKLSFVLFYAMELWHTPEACDGFNFQLIEENILLFAFLIRRLSKRSDSPVGLHLGLAAS